MVAVTVPGASGTSNDFTFQTTNNSTFQTTLLSTLSAALTTGESNGTIVRAYRRDTQGHKM